MRNIFELTKSEQRIVIAIVTILVAIAFARHLWQTKTQTGLENIISSGDAADPSRRR